jgi:ubiquinone biosynthesis protein
MAIIPDAGAASPPDDRRWGAFSDEAPWVLVDPSSPTWRTGLGARRRQVAAEAPVLSARRTFPPVRRMGRVSWHLGRALIGWRLHDRRRSGRGSIEGLSRRLRLAAEALGPTYIKLGQIISSGEGLFPEELVAEFRLCRDQVPAEPFDVVREVVEAELGMTIEACFSDFERTPLAAASIAQVHAATLRTGERVVVKVQRPAVARLVRHDLRVMAWLAPLLVGRIPVAALANPPALVDLFAETIVEELDFRLEAENMLDVAQMFVELDQRGYVIPRPHPSLVTQRVLVMERLDGFAFQDAAAIRAAGIDTRAVIRTGMIGFLEGCMLRGIFHGDLHAGNLFVMADGRTALLDFGITGRLDERRRLAFLRLVMSATSNNLLGQLDALRDLGALPPDADLNAVAAQLGLDQEAVDLTSLSPEQLTGEIQRVLKALLGIGARLPKDLMLFVKNMVFLDGAIATLAPDLDLFAELAEITTYFALHHGAQIAADVGTPVDAWEMDLTGIKASYGVDPAVTESLTYRELQARRGTLRGQIGGQDRRRIRRSLRTPRHLRSTGRADPRPDPHADTP